MALENILQSIEERRNAELDRIGRDYKQRLDALETETESRIAGLKSTYERRTVEDSRSLENRELSNADIEARKVLRGRKSELVEANLVKAYDFLDSLGSSASYGKIVSEMVATAKRLLGKNCTIRIGEKGAALVKESKGNKIVIDDVDPYGGLVAESSDGAMQLDLTFTTLKRELKERLMLEIAGKPGAK